MTAVATRRSVTSRATLGGRDLGCAVAFLAVFGLLGTGLLWWTTIQPLSRWVAARSWAEVPARVLDAKLEGDDTYRVAVRYAYAYEGRRYEGDRYALLSGSSNVGMDWKRAVVDQLQTTPDTTCWVDPKRPSDSVLRRELSSEMWFGLIPLLFAAVGWGGIAVVLTHRSRARRAAVEARAARSAGPSRVGMFLFGGVFVAVGVGIVYFLTVRPFLAVERAKQWAAVPAHVDRAEVDVRTSTSTSQGRTSTSTVYELEVEYRYEVAGRPYVGRRYDFTAGSSSFGRDRKERIAGELRANPDVTAWVNPTSPTEAVLDRSFGGEGWFGLIGLLFAGAGVLVWRVGGGASATPGARGARRSARTTDWDAAPAGADGAGPLSSGSTPVGRFFGMLFVAAFWNGLTVPLLVLPWLRGSSDAPPIIFPLIFGAIGALLAVGAVYYLLALANPRAEVTLAPVSPRLGDRCVLRWRLHGRASRIERLTIALTGHEEARYRRGTSTATDRHEFLKHVVVDVTSAAQALRGEVAFEVPAAAVPRFEAPNNKIVWQVALRLEIPKWPDVSEDYPLTVRAAAGRAPAGDA